METIGENHLSEVEEILKKKFNKEDKSFRELSTAAPTPEVPRLDQLILPLEERPRMPFTREKFIVRENPQLVTWERVTRQFLHGLFEKEEHRVSAVHIYEWATGIKIVDYMAANGNPPPDLRKINQVMRAYFGQSYTTYIMGRKIGKAYRIPKGWVVKRRPPKTMTLYAEWAEGTLRT